MEMAYEDCYAVSNLFLALQNCQSCNSMVVRMTLRWPWVSRRAYDALLLQLELTQSERNSYRDRGDRIYDETIMRFGMEPATPRVRDEIRNEVQEHEATLVMDSPFGDTMLDEEMVETIDAAVTASETQKPS